MKITMLFEEATLERFPLYAGGYGFCGLEITSDGEMDILNSYHLPDSIYISLPDYLHRSQIVSIAELIQDNLAAIMECTDSYHQSVMIDKLQQDVSDYCDDLDNLYMDLSEAIAFEWDFNTGTVDDLANAILDMDGDPCWFEFEQTIDTIKADLVETWLEDFDSGKALHSEQVSATLKALSSCDCERLAHFIYDLIDRVEDGEYNALEISIAIASVMQNRQ